MNDLFKFHQLNKDGRHKAIAIANSFTELTTFLESGVCYPGRELSIVRTKLEEACFFAKKAMAVDPTNQETP